MEFSRKSQGSYIISGFNIGKVKDTEDEVPDLNEEKEPL